MVLSLTLTVTAAPSVTVKPSLNPPLGLSLLSPTAARLTVGGIKSVSACKARAVTLGSSPSMAIADKTASYSVLLSTSPLGLSILKMSTPICRKANKSVALVRSLSVSSRVT